jgi:DNA-binding NarL/FixJ family response regulator
MPGMNGIEATRVICQAEPSIRVIILSMYHTGEHVFRAREVLQFVVEGKTSAAIAKILSLSPKSVETYRSRLMKKLGVTNVPSLVKFAMQHGFTSLE